jgi:hypothetical protein
MREVERVTTTRSFTKGEVIYTPGETGEALFLLRAGAVQIYRMSPEGRKLVIAQLLPTPSSARCPASVRACTTPSRRSSRTRPS